MLSLEKCKEILKQNGGKHSFEQVEWIRDLLYRFGTLDYKVFKAEKLQHKNNNIHSLSTDEQADSGGMS